jgi:hypothetical protein
MLIALNASAQYRFNQYTVTVATNAYIATNSYTSYNVAYDVGAGSTACIQLAFKMATNDYPHFATNDVITTWQSSLDGTRFTNQFQFKLTSTATATNTEVWGLTNFTVTYPWLKFVSISNLNQARLTNHSIKIGNKIGI